jgi:molybdate transport system ATP-binding protein
VGLADAVLGGAARGVLGLEGEENILEGVLERPVEGGLRLRVTEGLSLWVSEGPELAAGTRAAYAVLAEDILLSIAPLTGISARNVLEGTVKRVDEAGVSDRILMVEVVGVPLAVRVTEAAVRALSVRAGDRVFLAVKSSACRRLR